MNSSNSHFGDNFKIKELDRISDAKKKKFPSCSRVIDTDIPATVSGLHLCFLPVPPGIPVPVTWTHLAQTAATGSSSIHLMKEVTWKPGDQIVIASTGDRCSGAGGVDFKKQFKTEMTEMFVFNESVSVELEKLT